MGDQDVPEGANRAMSRCVKSKALGTHGRGSTDVRWNDPRFQRKVGGDMEFTPFERSAGRKGWNARREYLRQKRAGSDLKS